MGYWGDGAWWKRSGPSAAHLPVQDRLLQRRASWRTDRHHPETAASSEQCRSDCASGVEAIPCEAVTAPAALVASPAADHMQVGSSDVQSSEHVHSGLAARQNHGMCLQPSFMFTFHPAAGPTVHWDGLFQTSFPIFSTVCLELAATNSSDQ